jgi:predicted nucleotidyltransferase
MYGLDTEIINKIKTVFKNIPDITRVILYGSRAKGTYKNRFGYRPHFTRKKI